jgi:hypothetical protein
MRRDGGNCALTQRCKSRSFLYEVLLMELGTNSGREFIKSLTFEEYRMIHDEILTSSVQRLHLDGTLNRVLGLAAPFPSTALSVFKVSTVDPDGTECAHLLPRGALFPTPSDLTESLNACVGRHFEVDQGWDVWFMYDDEPACSVRWDDLHGFQQAAEKYARSGGKLLVELKWRL